MAKGRTSALTPQAFADKWSASRLKESAAYQEHFLDLCHMLGQGTPAEMDHDGKFYTFQKGVTKTRIKGKVIEETLFGPQEVDPKKPGKGFADVWFKGHFGWEYKGKHKDLDKAYEQLLQYREDLENPPLLVVCDFSRFRIHTQFNDCVAKTYEFANEDIPKPENLLILRNLWEHPDALKPGLTVEAVTKEAARQLAKLAENMRARKVEPHRAAHFLMKLLFCLYAEDADLLPNRLFERIVKAGLDEDGAFDKEIKQLFKAMASGGRAYLENIDHFNGGLFDNTDTEELTGEDLELLYRCAKQDWSSIEPSIFGTLFERCLDPAKRSQLGAHYTSRADIETLVEPVLMKPLRREWEAVQERARKARRAMDEADEGGKEKAKRRKALEKVLSDFAYKLSTMRVLDPACGSGNFLYVSLHLLLDLEKEVFNLAEKNGIEIHRLVGPHQLYGLEISPYAAEIAQLVVWIGYLQWNKKNGLYRFEDPILKPLDTIKEMDAILDLSDPKHPKEPAWPECDVIVGNPPFLGGKMLRRELKDEYVDAMFATWDGRVPREADLCCYWFEKARSHIQVKKCGRAGLLATQGIRGGANRKVLDRIKETGDIFFAVSDRDWVLDGATVHIAMVGFDGGGETVRTLDGGKAETINSNLSFQAGVTQTCILNANSNLSFMGITPAGPFDVSFEDGKKLLVSPNPSGKPTADVVRPYLNGKDLNQRARDQFTVDYGTDMELGTAAQYESAFEYIKGSVLPERRRNNRKAYRDYWWRYAEARSSMREAFASHERYIATCMVAKHRIFVWLPIVSLPANVVIVIARSDDFFFGVLHSRFHEIWARAQGTQLRERESGFRYTPTTCFETFPLPRPTPAQEAAIAAAAKELDTLRNNWLNPPEWTKEEVLEFPGSVDGPWKRYVHKPDARGIGTVRYPRTVPKDAECAKKLAKRTLTNLYNERPTWLDEAHKKLDAAVCAAYGWPADLSDDQILEKLLALNLERAAEERAAAEKEKGGPKAKKEKKPKAEKTAKAEKAQTGKRKKR